MNFLETTWKRGKDVELDGIMLVTYQEMQTGVEIKIPASLETAIREDYKKILEAEMKRAMDNPLIKSILGNF